MVWLVIDYCSRFTVIISHDIPLPLHPLRHLAQAALSRVDSEVYEAAIAKQWKPGESCSHNIQEILNCIIRLNLLSFLWTLSWFDCGGIGWWLEWWPSFALCNTPISTFTAWKILPLSSLSLLALQYLYLPTSAGWVWAGCQRFARFKKPSSELVSRCGSQFLGAVGSSWEFPKLHGLCKSWLKIATLVAHPTSHEPRAKAGQLRLWGPAGVVFFFCKCVFWLCTAT